MRRKIALVLALVMILSLIPMSAFAASANRVTTVVRAQEDDDLFVNAPGTYLVIRDDRGDLEGPQTISLTLENAEWRSGSDTWMNVAGRVYGQVADFDAFRVSSNRMDIEFELTGAADRDEEIRIPLFTRVKEGDARVTVVPQDSQVSGGTWTFATVVDGKTAITVASKTFGPEETVRLNNIIIDEVSANTIQENSVITLELPRDFEWVWDFDADGNPIVPSVRFSGGITTAAGEQVQQLTDLGTTGDPGYKFGERKITLDLSQFDFTASSDRRGSIVLQNFAITSDSTRFGDVMVRFEGNDITNTSVKVAEYADFAVVVEADGDIEEVIAGRFDDVTLEAGFELATLIFEEKVADSIVRGRKVTVEFPDWVKLTDVDGGDVNVVWEAGDNEFEFTPTGTSKIEYEFDIEVTVEADAVGDIIAEITGRGLDRDYEVVLGTAIAPVTVEMELSEVLIGESGQAIADIIITENVAGALMEGDLEILFDLRDMRIHSGYAVVSVDDEETGLEIDDVDVVYENGFAMLVIEIERESDEPGVIEVTGLRVSMNRIPATGDYDVKVGGSALVNNNLKFWEDRADFDEDEDMELFETDYVWEAPMLRVVTERTVVAAGEIAFTIGQMAYMVDGEMMMMDVAPFISNGRTMIPVRYLEELFGMQPIWNPVARTVTVMYDGMVFEMTIGSNMLRVNGAPFMEMDAEAVIIDSRTFVPASRFARAMGIEYTWEPTTQTATFFR